MISLGLDQAFSLGLNRVPSRLKIQDVDVGLALAAALNGQIAIGLKRFEMFADVGLVQAHVIGEPSLAGEAMIVLPRVAQQHGEGQFVASAQRLRLEEKIRDLGKSTKGGCVSADELDVAVFENVADVAAFILHAGIIPHRSAQYGLSPLHRIGRCLTCSAEQRRQHFL